MSTKKSSSSPRKRAATPVKSSVDPSRGSPIPSSNLRPTQGSTPSKKGQAGRKQAALEEERLNQEREERDECIRGILQLVIERAEREVDWKSIQPKIIPFAVQRAWKEVMTVMRICFVPRTRDWMEERTVLDNWGTEDVEPPTCAIDTWATEVIPVKKRRRNTGEETEGPTTATQQQPAAGGMRRRRGSISRGRVSIESLPPEQVKSLSEESVSHPRLSPKSPLSDEERSEEEKLREEVKARRAKEGIKNLKGELDEDEAKRLANLHRVLRGQDYSYGYKGEVVLMSKWQPEKLPPYAVDLKIRLKDAEPAVGAGSGNKGGGGGGGGGGGLAAETTTTAAAGGGGGGRGEGGGEAITKRRTGDAASAVEKPAAMTARGRKESGLPQREREGIQVEEEKGGGGGGGGGTGVAMSVEALLASMKLATGVTVRAGNYFKSGGRASGEGGGGPSYAGGFSDFAGVPFRTRAAVVGGGGGGGGRGGGDGLLSPVEVVPRLAGDETRSVGRIPLGVFPPSTLVNVRARQVGGGGGGGGGVLSRPSPRKGDGKGTKLKKTGLMAETRDTKPKGGLPINPPREGRAKNRADMAKLQKARTPTSRSPTKSLDPPPSLPHRVSSYQRHRAVGNVSRLPRHRPHVQAPSVEAIAEASRHHLLHQQERSTHQSPVRRPAKTLLPFGVIKGLNR
ncbi:hypothetical protein CBR_g40387 [Chara braunii]|uniref:Uncharacterized protein n=1 Tax=Chara braunii TaxID=69332 RepID=A0A388LTL3_CHABU|nr:hypothetical protein CBR_g40387 [Chara braunii]|eukprot:GBG85656.1 hypothetical protein CBR_g40387 [Chara braunii]